MLILLATNFTFIFASSLLQYLVTVLSMAVVRGPIVTVFFAMQPQSVPRTGAGKRFSALSQYPYQLGKAVSVKLKRQLPAQFKDRRMSRNVLVYVPLTLQ